MSNEKRLTPLKAIRKYCLWCCSGNCAEIRKCYVLSCALYQYRSGHRTHYVEKTPCKAIKAKCTDCSGFDAQERMNCKFTDCSLYKFRNGHNPARSGCGNIHIKQNLAKYANTNCNLKNENVSQV